MIIIFNVKKIKQLSSTLHQQVDAMGRQAVLLQTNFAHSRTCHVFNRLDAIHHHRGQSLQSEGGHGGCG